MTVGDCLCRSWEEHLELAVPAWWARAAVPVGREGSPNQAASTERRLLLSTLLLSALSHLCIPRAQVQPPPSAGPCMSRSISEPGTLHNIQGRGKGPACSASSALHQPLQRPE